VVSGVNEEIEACELGTLARQRLQSEILGQRLKIAGIELNEARFDLNRDRVEGEISSILGVSRQ
jgi:hypothetical protein